MIMSSLATRTSPGWIATTLIEYIEFDLKGGGNNFDSEINFMYFEIFDDRVLLQF